MLLFSIPALAVLLWVIAIPESLIIRLFEEPLQKAGMAIETEGFGKGLFYNFRSGSISLKRQGENLIYIKDFKGQLNPLYLFILKLQLSFEGSIGEGTIAGSALIGKSDYEIKIDIADIDLKNIRLTETLGSGKLKGDVFLKSGKGSAKFSITEAAFKELSASGTLLPLNLFNRATGVINFNGPLIEANPVSLEGNGVYARVKGTIRGRDLDMKLELMPDSSFMPDYLMSSSLGRYKASAGYYVIPIKTVINF